MLNKIGSGGICTGALEFVPLAPLQLQLLLLLPPPLLSPPPLPPPLPVSLIWLSSAFLKTLN